MATTLIAPASTSDDLVHLSFPIVKFEKNADGDLVVYGKATDSSVDSDEQIVDSDFSSKAITDWLASGGNVRVQHNSQRDPAGVGIEASTDGDGATWVKSLVIEPIAKTLVEKGALRAYSVGIARPKIVRDSVARGGRIVDGQIVEISLVDRPANKNCGIQLVKAMTIGDAPQWVGEVWGVEDESDTVNVDLPKGASISFSPADLAKLMGVKKNLEADVEKRDFDRGVGGGTDRDKIPAGDFAGPDRSFPIVTPKDVADAAGLAGHASDPDAVRARIRSIAHRKGPEFVAQIPDSWTSDANKSADEPDDTEDVEDTNDEKLSNQAKKADAETPVVKGGDGDDEDEDAEESGEDQDDTEDAGKANAEPDVEKAGAKKCGSCGKNYHADSKLKKCTCGAKLPKANKSVKPLTVNVGGQRFISDSDLAQLVEKMTAAFTQTSAAEPEVEKKSKVMCAGCGANIHDKHKFCPECGKSTATAKPLKKNHDFSCTKCMKNLDKGEKFCGNCGKKNPGYLPAADSKVKADKTEVEKGKPTPADGASGAGAADIKAVPEHREPDGPDIESLEHDMHVPTVPDSEVELKAAQRVKSVGAPYHLGALHDLTCPGFHPDEATKAHPTVAAGLELDYWRDLAEQAIYGGTFEEAQKTAQLLQAAQTVQTADGGGYFGAALAAHKAFQDANSSISGFPSPTVISPTQFQRPVITAGHAKPGTDYDAPNAPGKVPASGGIHAGDFDRDYLQAGHGASSPSNKSLGEAMLLLHDYLAERYPALCSLTLKAAAPEEPVTEAAAADEQSAEKAKKPKKDKGKKNKPPVADSSSDSDSQTDDGGGDAGTDDGDDQAADKSVTKAITLDVDLIKSAVTEATGGLLEKLTEMEKSLKVERKKNEKLAEAVDQMAGMADPRVDAYRATSLLSPASKKNVSPAGWNTVAETAERTQAALMDVLLADARTNESSAVREAAWDEIYRMNGIGGH